MKTLKFTSLLVGFATAALAAQAISVNFTSGPTDTANGFINIPIGSSSATYSNIGNQGFDIKFNFTDNAALTFDTLPTTNGPELTSALVLLGNNSFFEVEFFETGTSNPVVVRGVQFRIDDVEKGVSNNESITNFSYVDSKGNLKNPLFDDAIFTPDANPNINLNQPFPDTSVFFSNNLDSLFQIGKGVLVDLSDQGVQSFRFEREVIGVGNTAITLGLGDPTPVPFDTNPMLGFVVIAGYLGWRIRRKAKLAPTAEAVA